MTAPVPPGPGAPFPPGPPRVTPAPRRLELGRLAIAWPLAIVLVQVVGGLLTAALFSGASVDRLWLLGLVNAVLGFVVGLVAAAVAVLVLAAGGRAAGRPAWHWVVAAVPPLVLSALFGMAVRFAMVRGFIETPLTIGLLLLQLAAAAGVAVGLGTLLRRTAERRAARPWAAAAGATAEGAVPGGPAL